MSDKLISTNRPDILEGISAIIGNKETDDSRQSGKLNLIRAINDHAQNEIDYIDKQLEKLEIKKNELLQEKAAHIEILAVAQKYTSLKVST